MQYLSLDSLAGLSGTCRQMKELALHPQAGRFLSQGVMFRENLADQEEQDGYEGTPAKKYARVWNKQCVWVNKYVSSLALAHNPFILPLESATPDSTRVKQIVQLTWCGSVSPYESFVLEILERPSLARSVTTLEIKAVRMYKRADAYQNMSPDIQFALFSLPHLTHLVVDSSRQVQPRLHPAALQHAVHLQRVDIVRGDLCNVLGQLAAATLPSLTHLRLLFVFEENELGEKELGEIVARLLLSAPWLGQLERFDLRHAPIARDCGRGLAAHLSTLLSHMPLLHTLLLDGSVDMILHACMRTGARSLSALRFIRISPGDEDAPPPTVKCIRRFLHKFPLVEEVHIAAEGECQDQCILLFGHLARVRFSNTKTRLLSPHASDDDSEPEEPDYLFN